MADDRESTDQLPGSRAGRDPLALIDAGLVGVAGRLRAGSPDRYRRLVAAVADHLRDKIVEGEHDLLPELAELVADPDLRWGLVGDRERYRVDPPRPGDDRLLTSGSHLTEEELAWPLRYLRDAPESVLIARGSAGEMAGLSIAVTLETAPPWVDEDPVLGPWLAHARRHAAEGNAVLWRDEIELDRADDSSVGADRASVIATLNAAVVNSTDLTNLRWFYGCVDPTRPEMVRLSEAMGAVHVPGMDALDGGRTVRLYVLDHGPGGFVDTVHRMVHTSLGLEPPSRPPSMLEVVEQALRSFHDTRGLARSPLAGSEGTPSERAERVRALIRQATSEAFTDVPSDRELRSVLECGYLAVDANHSAVARHLHLGRATYFRRLREARRRLADHLTSP